MVIDVTRLNHSASIISSALAVDGLALVLDLIFCTAAIACVLLSLRSAHPPAPVTASTTRCCCSACSAWRSWSPPRT